MTKLNIPDLLIAACIPDLRSSSQACSIGQAWDALDAVRDTVEGLRPGFQITDLREVHKWSVHKWSFLPRDLRTLSGRRGGDFRRNYLHSISSVTHVVTKPCDRYTGGGFPYLARTSDAVRDIESGFFRLDHGPPTPEVCRSVGPLPAHLLFARRVTRTSHPIIQNPRSGISSLASFVWQS